MKQQAYEQVLRLIIDEYRNGAVGGHHMSNYISKAEILLKGGDVSVSVIRELVNK